MMIETLVISTAVGGAGYLVMRLIGALLEDEQARRHGPLLVGVVAALLVVALVGAAAWHVSIR